MLSEAWWHWNLLFWEIKWRITYSIVSPVWYNIHRLEYWIDLSFLLSETWKLIRATFGESDFADDSFFGEKNLLIFGPIRRFV